MFYEEAFQLNTSKCKTVFAFASIYGKKESLVVYKKKEENYTLVGKYPFKDIVSIKIPEHRYIIVQCKHELYYLDMEKNSIIKLPFIKDKFFDVYHFDTKSIIYSVQLHFELIEFKLMNLENNEIEPLLNLKTDTLMTTILSDKIDNSITEYSLELISQLKRYRCNNIDSHKEKTMNILQNYLSYELFISNQKIYESQGHINSAYILDCSKVIILTSNFDSPRHVKLIDYSSNSITELSGYSNKNNFKISVKHDFLGEKKVPTYVIGDVKTAKKIVIYLHGGPTTRVRPDYLPYLEDLITNNIAVYMLNYTGSTGYGMDFYKKLFNNNAVIAMDDIRSILKMNENINSVKYTIIGESFGAYLAVLCSFIDNSRIDKCISVNGFVDYRYQYLFSISKEMICDYFDVKISLNNPVDLLEDKLPVNKLIFIHSEEDIHCPIGQITNFYNRVNNSNGDIKLYRINGQDHYSMSHLDNREKYELMLCEMLS